MFIRLSIIPSLLIVLLLACTGDARSQSDSASKSGSRMLIPTKILSARHDFSVNNVRGALALYREVLAIDSTNGSANFGVAECHYQQKKYALALEYAEKAVRYGHDVPALFAGQCYQRQAKLDHAIEKYREFLATNPSDFDKETALKYIDECEFAKVQMNAPVSVTIEHLGAAINSRFEEYTPSITQDGTTLYFTSRRSDTKGGRIDEFGDYKFFEDIYYSTYDTENENWSIAQSLPGEVNTEAYDAILSVFPDGKGIFVYRNKGASAGDIFMSLKTEGDSLFFMEASKVSRPINSSYYEGSISMTADGNTVYFISERPEGNGMGDIYVSHRKGNSWSSPKNLGKTVNTIFDEKFVFIHPNGRTLYFASNGHRTMGSYDIFRTEMVNGEWSAPVNLGFPINTVNEESTFSLTRDNHYLYLAAEYADTYGERDIYRVDISKYPLLASGYDKTQTGQVICSVTDSEKKPMRGVVVSVYLEGDKKPLMEIKTDKEGHAIFNLTGGVKYEIKATSKNEVKGTEVNLELKKEGDTIVPVAFQF